MQRLCTRCKYEISPARLAAMPDATMCVSCLQKTGDVPVIKKIEEYTENGEQLNEQYFTKNPYFEDAIQRFMRGFTGVSGMDLCEA